jgi:hypothetical protein
MTDNTITQEQFEKALARACLREIAKWSREDPLRGGDQTAVRYGALIGQIADEADLTVSQTRRRLLAMYREGKVLRDDRRGGSTAWWPVGLAGQQMTGPAPALYGVPPVAARPAQRQAVTPAAPAKRQHWSDVLGVPRDCSTSEARAAFRAAVAALDEADPDYPNQSRRVRDAIDACCCEHEIQIEE